jgi:hypothetical protein
MKCWLLPSFLLSTQLTHTKKTCQENTMLLQCSTDYTTGKVILDLSIRTGTRFFSSRNIQTGTGTQWGNYSVSVTGTLSLGIKGPEHEANYSLPHSAKFKNTWSYISTLPMYLHGVQWDKVYVFCFTVTQCYWLLNKCYLHTNIRCIFWITSMSMDIQTQPWTFYNLVRKAQDLIANTSVLPKRQHAIILNVGFKKLQFFFF